VASATHHDEHRITVQAPPEVVYDVIADVRRWPYVFAPTVHAERIEHAAGEERIRLWALANGAVKTWTSRRELDRAGLRVRFAQEVSQPPVAEMRGEWILTPAGERTTDVVLTHDYRAERDDPGGTEWIREAVDRNSRAELENLRLATELVHDSDELAVTFEDSLRIDGARADVYDFLYAATRWPERLSHVARLDLREDTRNVQVMEMDTRGADGSVHTTRSIRICFPDDRIVYKQTEVPALMAAHVGEWRLTDEAGGAVTASSRHTVVIKREAVQPVLGAGSTVRKARGFVQRALSANSMATLQRARAFAQERRHG
jgi:ribosome-associated toxin RatA of RatAB toxin-antitoxin module